MWRTDLFTYCSDHYGECFPYRRWLQGEEPGEETWSQYLAATYHEIMVPFVSFDEVRSLCVSGDRCFESKRELCEIADFLPNGRAISDAVGLGECSQCQEFVPEHQQKQHKIFSCSAREVLCDRCLTPMQAGKLATHKQVCLSDRDIHLPACDAEPAVVLKKQRGAKELVHQPVSDDEAQLFIW